MKETNQNQEVGENNTLKPIEPILRKMELYDPEFYPIERSPSVISGMRRVNIQTKKRFKTKSNREEGTIRITRIA